MAEIRPASQRSLALNDAPAPSWEEVLERLKEGASHSPSINGTYWLSTVRPDARPHVMPLFGVWLDGAMYFCSGPAARKARNIAVSPHCVITCGARDYDIIIEGDATKVTDEARLQKVADEYAAKYGWQVTVRNAAFDAEYGAPSAGPPPFEVYEVVPATVFALGTSMPFGAARWQF